MSGSIGEQDVNKVAPRMWPDVKKNAIFAENKESR